MSSWLSQCSNWNRNCFIPSTYFCMGLSSTLTMSSVFEGMCLKTSAFSLLSMCGPNMSWSFLIWSSLAMSANSSRNPSRLLQGGNKHIRTGKAWDILNMQSLHARLLTWISPGSRSSASGRAPPGCSEEGCRLAAACVAEGSCSTLERTNNRQTEAEQKGRFFFFKLEKTSRCKSKNWLQVLHFTERVHKYFD